MSVIEHIISLIAPHTCLACSAEGVLLCNQCVRSLPAAAERCFMCAAPSTNSATCTSCQNATNLRCVMSATPHSDVAKDITHQLKYARTKAAIDPMVAAMNQRCLIDPEAIITFAPAATNRVRMRGYDQSYLLAKSLGRVCGHPVVPLIARMHNTRQVGSSGQQRRVQQQDAFRVINAHAAANQKILIVDDVITTGSTLQACAALLAAAGARKVDACTFAQA